MFNSRNRNNIFVKMCRYLHKFNIFNLHVLEISKKWLKENGMTCCIRFT